MRTCVLAIPLLFIFFGAQKAASQTTSAATNPQTPPTGLPAESKKENPPADYNVNRSRWEFIPTGSTGLGSQPNANGVPPSLTGTDANFLFRLDQLIKAPNKTAGKLDMHIIFDIGVTNPAKAI